MAAFSPTRRPPAVSVARFLPYGVSGDTGNAGVGDGESLPLLVGEKFLPLSPSGSGGYAAAAVWKWYRDSGECHFLTARRVPTGGRSPCTATAGGHGKLGRASVTRRKRESLWPVHPPTHGAGRDGWARGETG